MAITLDEKFQSRASSGGANPSCELVYILRGSDDEVALKAALEAGTPLIHDSMVRQSWSVEQQGNSLWQGTVKYGSPQGSTDPVASDIGTVTITVDTSGGTQHLTQSLQTISRTGARIDGVDLTPPNFYGAIGVTHEAVDGVDIGMPDFKFTVSKIYWTTDNPDPEGDPYPVEHELPQYADLYQLTRKTNQAEFTVTDSVTGRSITLAIGECLCMGVRVSEARADGAVTVSYEFGASPNVTDLVIGLITVPAKKGWEYLWVRYADAEDSGAKMIVKRAVAAYVERVYGPGDYAKFKLTPPPP